MNWDAIGAIGEVGGAIGVIATLIYLAGQLRQNTNALRSSSYQHWNEVSSSWSQFSARYASELCEIEKATSFAELTPEQLKLHQAMSVFVVNQAETAFLQYRAGTLDRDVFEARMRSFVAFWTMEQNHLLREVWSTVAKTHHTPGFVEEIESRVSGLKPNPV